MNTNIYLAQLLAKERQHDITTAAEERRRLREALPAREPLTARIHHLLHHDGGRSMTGPTCETA
jgi:hypothetical protein